MTPLIFVVLVSCVSVLAMSLSICAVVRAAKRHRAEARRRPGEARLPAVQEARRSPGEARLPIPARLPVTVLKPLCGADDRLEQNLETFFLQTHPDYELVFGIEGHADPALAVVRRLRERYPRVRCRLVVHSGGRAMNPKVNNLEQMMGAAHDTHDLLVISDSNVAVPPGWLAELTATFVSNPRHGLVMNLFSGVGEETLGATLENLHLAGPVAGSLAFADRWLGRTDAVGKSMMFSRAAFDTLGGMASVSTVLAEDFVMGRMFAAAGYHVVLAQTIVANVTQRATVRRFLARQLRWNLMRSRVMGPTYPLEPLVSPMLPALLSPLAGAYMPLFFFGGLALTMARDAAQWLALRGPRGLLSALPLGPLKEVALLVVWAVAPFRSRVAWRGKRYRIGAGTRLYAESPSRTAPTAQWE